MTEMEFFSEYEIKPSPGQAGKAVEIWKRTSGIYGKVHARKGIDGKTEYVVYAGYDSILGVRKTFSAALKLFIRGLSN